MPFFIPSPIRYVSAQTKQEDGMSLRFEGNFWSTSDNSVGYDVSIGTFSSATAGIGKTVSSTKTKALDVCVDNNGETLPSGTPVRAIRARALVTATQTGEAVAYGSQSQCKVTGDVSAATGFFAGCWSYLETVSGATLGDKSAGLCAMLDLPSGATIAASAYVAGLMISSYDLGGTHTGKASAIYVTTPRAGTWDYGMVFGATSGCTVANTHSIDSHALNQLIKVNIGGTDGFIPVFAAAPA
jgi:hypothetical protein